MFHADCGIERFMVVEGECRPLEVLKLGPDGRGEGAANFNSDRLKHGPVVSRMEQVSMEKWADLESNEAPVTACFGSIHCRIRDLGSFRVRKSNARSLCRPRQRREVAFYPARFR